MNNTDQRRPSEAIAYVALLLPVFGAFLALLWVGSMRLLDNPTASLMLLAVSVVSATSVLIALDVAQLTVDRPLAGVGLWWRYAFLVALWPIGFGLHFSLRSPMGGRNFSLVAFGNAIIFCVVVGWVGHAIDIANAPLLQRFDEIRRALER